MNLDERLALSAQRVAGRLTPPEIDAEALRARARSTQRRTASLAVLSAAVAVIAVGATVVGSRDSSAPDPGPVVTPTIVFASEDSRRLLRMR
jgi:hypothetical protein